MIEARASIQNRLTISLTLTIVALFGMSALGLYFYMRNAFFEQADKNLMRVVEDFMHETERTPNGGLECEFHELDIEQFRKKGDAGAAYYELRDYLGNALIRSASLSDNENLPYHPVETGKFETKPIRLPGQVSGRIIFTSFPLKLDAHAHENREDTVGSTPLAPVDKAFVESYDKNHPENRVYLAIAEAPADLHQTLFILGSALSVTGIILAGTTLFLVQKMVLSAFRPIIKIAQLTEQMGPDNLNTPLPVEQVPMELLPLITRFNQLIKRLDNAINKERRFSIDLAHEIRSPVAEIRSLMEVSASSAENNNADDPFDIYQRGSTISKRMSKIIEVITAIHQENSTVVHFASEPVSIESILKDAIGAFDSSKQSRFHIESNNALDGSVDTDPDLLRAVIDNLLINAVTHSPAESKILVSCQDHRFTVRNKTTELEESDLPLLTEAFWQKDSSRTETQQFGLGLTLVAMYLRLLKGQINHSLNDGELTTKVILGGKESAKLSSKP